MPSADEASASQFEGATEQTGRGRPGSPVDPYRLGRALLWGKRWLIGAAVLGAIVGFLWVKLMMFSAYQTTVTLQYEGDLQVAGMPATNSTVAPAADALRRQSVLRKIAEESDFEGSLTALGRSFGYDIDLMTNTLHITVSGDTGEEAAEYARVVTDVFMAYHKERQSKRIEEELARGRKRIEAGEHEAEIARRRYNEFREKHGIADLSTEQQSMVESAAKLRAESELTISELRGLEAEVASLEGQLAKIPKTSFVSSGKSPERAAYNRMREELAEAQATLSPSHPRVQALLQQVNQLRAQMGQGSGTSASGDGLVGVNTTYQAVDEKLREAKSHLAALRERQRGLSGMADKAQERVEAFSDIEGEASALLADVQVSENLVSGLRRTEAALEDALRDPPSGFVVLDPGAVPEYPMRNKAKLVVFAAIPILSVAVVLLLVLRREFHGLRVETPAEVAYWGSGPVLGSTPWPNDPRGLDELVAGLDDFVPEAKGTMLIIGASRDEASLAKDLADRINDDWFIEQRTVESRDVPGPPRPEQGPLHAPPPSGPYPIGRVGSQSVALARRPPAPMPQQIRLLEGVEPLRPEAWDGPFEGQGIRRAARLADRIIILVRSGAISALRLNQVHNRIGRRHGIGYVVVGLPDELRKLPDRVGDVAGFWRA
ncbi:MAG: hypothetical protein WCE62_03645 [Polyangiales bacterium]